MRRQFLAASLLLAVAASGGAAQAQDTFLGSVNSDWDTGANWSGGVPLGTDNALIIGKGVNKTGGNITVASLSLLNSAQLDLFGTTSVNTASFICGNTGTNAAGGGLYLGSSSGGSSFTLNSGSTLSGNISAINTEYANNTLTNNGTITSNHSGTTTFLDGAITNNGTFQVSNGANLTSGNDNFLVTTITNNGTFAVSGGGNTTFDAGNFVNNGTFNINSGTFTNYDTLSGSSAYSLSNATFTMGGGALNGVTVQGTNSTIGSLVGTLNGATLTGFSTINVSGLGSLNVENGSSIDASSFALTNGGQLVITGNTNNIAATSYTFGNTGTNTSGGGFYLGSASGGSSFTLNSGSTMSGNINAINTEYANNTFTNNGAIASNHSGTTTSLNGAITNNGIFQVSNGANLTVGNASLAFVTSVTNNGTFNIESGSKATFDSAFTQTGGRLIADGNITVSSGVAVNLQGGTLTGTASIGGTGAILNNTAGVVSAGDSGEVGSLVINGAYKQSGAGAMLVDLGGAGTGMFDFLTINGAATLGGTLEIDLLNGFTPTVGETFNFLDYTSRSGSGAFAVDSLDSGYDYSVTYGTNSATITVTQAAASSASSAPEPTSVLLIGAGIPTALLLRRRRRK